eukprot:1728227-Amphidinium_carterae.1
MQRAKLLQHGWDMVAIKSLEARGALGRLLSIDYFVLGETLILTHKGKLMKGLKPRPMDENVLRVSRQWNQVHHDPDEEQQW